MAVNEHNLFGPLSFVGWAPVPPTPPLPPKNNNRKKCIYSPDGLSSLRFIAPLSDRGFYVPVSAHTVWHHHHGHYSQKGSVLVLSVSSQYVFMYMNDAHFICKNKPFPPHEWWSVMRAILERLVGGPAVHTCPLDTWSVGQVLSLSVMPHDNWQFPLSSIPPPLLPMPWHFLLRLSFV